MAVDSLKLVKKVLIPIHNLNVVKVFSKHHDLNDIKSAEAAVRNACLIRTKDSAPIIALKILLFYVVLGYLKIEVGLPQEWIPRPINIPQLIITYRPKNKADSHLGSRQTVIPHYKGGRKPSLPDYHSGNNYAVLSLKDNSQLQINAISEAEAERVIHSLMKFVDPTYITDVPRFGKRKGKPTKQVEWQAYMVTFHPRGKNGASGWRDYYV